MAEKEQQLRSQLDLTRCKPGAVSCLKVSNFAQLHDRTMQFVPHRGLQLHPGLGSRCPRHRLSERRFFHEVRPPQFTASLNFSEVRLLALRGGLGGARPFPKLRVDRT